MKKTPAKKTLATALCTLALTAALTGCYTMNHRVGNGAQGSSEVEKRQWFALWGLVPLGEVDSHALANNATHYDVQTQMSVVDFLLNLVTGWVTITSRTVTVTR